jgi:hypothetical protein
LVLKGAALTARLYHDTGVRPMGDVDVLVRLEDAEAAYKILLSQAWWPDIAPGGDMARVLQVVRSLDLVRADGARLDLHWHVLADNCDPGDDDDFWAASEVVEFFDGLSVRTLCHTDLLLHAVVHGSKWSSTRSVLWVMDAFRLIAAADAAVDWARLVRQARQRSVSTAVLSALTWLRDSLDADIPAKVLAELRQVKTGLLERLNYQSQSSEDTAAGTARRELLDYLNRTRRRPLMSRLRGWAWYLQVIWGVSDARRLPYEVVRRLYRRRPTNQESFQRAARQL